MNGHLAWQPVLYGRTLRADKWWRVLPPNVDVRWLNALMIAATGSGDSLSDAPRMLMARRGNVVLVGAACWAALLSKGMNSDGNRPFYCFVGWLSPDPDAVVPSLEALQERWVPWAREVYEGWMRVDWNKHPSDLTNAHEPPFGAAPWTGTVAELGATRDAIRAPQRASIPASGRITVVPVEAAGGAWLDLFESAGDFAIAGPFEQPVADSAGILTHIVANVSRADSAGVIPARAPDPAKMPAPEQAGPPWRDSADQRMSDSQPRESPLPPPPAMERPPPPAMERPTGHEPHRRRFRDKAGRAFRSLTGAQEASYEDDINDPRTDRQEAEDPSHGPAKDLNYWRRQHETAPDSRSNKEPPQLG